MFDLGWPELLLIMVVALVVIGPKDLPAAIRAVSDIMRTIRKAARDFQNSLDDMARESGLDEVKREFDGMRRYDPSDDVKRETGLDELEYGNELDPATGNSILDEGKDKASTGATVPDGARDEGPTTAAAPAPPDGDMSEPDEPSGDATTRPSGGTGTTGGAA